jgi:hypothetical protein
MNINDSRQIQLNTNGATKNNLSFNSDVLFNIPNLIKKQNYILYNTIRIIHCEIPFSFYIINEYNNLLALSTGNISITYGNYNANSFITALSLLLPTNMTITLNSSNGKFTLSYNASFSILATSTINKIMGFSKNITYTSTSNNIILPYPANFLGTNNIYVKSPNLILENYNTSTKDYITMSNIPVNVPPFGIVQYLNQTGSKNIVKNIQMDNLEIQITDDDNNLIDFNNLEWSITIEIESIMQFNYNPKTLEDYFNGNNQINENN